MSAIGADDAAAEKAPTGPPVFFISGVDGDRRVIIRRSSGGYSKGIVSYVKSDATFVRMDAPQTMSAEVLVDQHLSGHPMSKTVPFYRFVGEERTLIGGQDVGAVDFNAMWDVLEDNKHHSYAELLGE